MMERHRANGMGTQNVLRLVICAAALAGAVPTTVIGNEIDGFRLGMTTAQVRTVAAEKGYTFSNAMKNGANWVSYVLFKDGPSISFCGDVLSSVTKSHKTNLHELANLLERWTKSLGAPDETTASQTFVEGVPFSNLSYRWLGQDNLRRQIGFSQHGTDGTQVSHGYSYIDHPCRSR
jgi:hypothetical protein